MLRLFLDITIILSFLLSPIFVKGQNQVNRTCNMLEIHLQNMQDPKYREAFTEKMKRSVSKRDLSRDLCADPVILPMAVHYSGIPNPSAADKACLEALALDQIQILNDDYHGTNVDISNWASASANYPGVSNGETCVSFCLATQNHPSGYNLNDGDFAITYNEVTGDFNSDWAGYINIWVKDIGALGYSPLGGNGNGDGVAIDIEAFGSGSGCSAVNVVPDPPYHLGRTLTHELGHYLLLGHIWGGGCGADDGIADTPDASSPNYGCPSPTSSSCGSIDMHMNYMDYTNDACMYMFSAGQSTVMENYANSDLSALISNADLVCKNAVSFAVSASSILEGSDHCSDLPINTMTVELQISAAPDEDVIVSIELDAASTATQFEDFGSFSTTIVFPAGSGSNQIIDIPVYHDGKVEANESIVLTIIDVTGGDVVAGSSNQSHSAIIVNDDLTPSTGGVVSFLNEGFENNAPGWQVIDGGNTTDTWHFPDSYSGNSLDGSPFAFVDSDASGNGSTNYEQLISPVMNTSGAIDLTLSFSHYFNSYNQGYTENIDVDVFDGNIWQNVFHEIGNGDIGSWNNPAIESIDILPYANANMQVRFTYDGQYDWYWAVDNVMVEGSQVTNVQSNINSVTSYAEHHLGPFETIHFYDLVNDNIMATIENMSSHDFGCTKVEILTEGNGASPSSANGYSDLTDKTFFITPEFNNASAPFLITLYYTSAEIDGYVANNTQGSSLIDLLVVKSTDPVIGASSLQAAIPTINSFNADWAFEALFNTGFSGFGLANTGLLSVEFIYFEGLSRTNDILLRWETGFEENNKGFHVTRSDDGGESFNRIGWVGANTNFEYYFNDSTVKVGRQYYYQLIQEDYDGAQSMSNIISLGLDSKQSEINVYPNPTKDFIHINRPTSLHNLSYEVRNSLGERIISPTDAELINTSTLPRGIYFLIVFQNERLVETKKFLKL